MCPVLWVKYAVLLIQPNLEAEERKCFDKNEHAHLNKEPANQMYRHRFRYLNSGLYFIHRVQ